MATLLDNGQSSAVSRWKFLDISTSQFVSCGSILQSFSLFLGDPDAELILGPPDLNFAPLVAIYSNW